MKTYISHQLLPTTSGRGPARDIPAGSHTAPPELGRQQPTPLAGQYGCPSIQSHWLQGAGRPRRPTSFQGLQPLACCCCVSSLSVLLLLLLRCCAALRLCGFAIVAVAIASVAAVAIALVVALVVALALPLWECSWSRSRGVGQNLLEIIPSAV